MSTEPTGRPPGRQGRPAPRRRRAHRGAPRRGPGARPAYVDLTSGERAAQRRIIPEHWRTWEDAEAAPVSWRAARHGHRAAYHGVRSPGVLRQGGRVRRVGRVRRHQAPDRLVAHPGHGRARARGRRGRAAERPPAAAQGRARRPARRAAPSSRCASPRWPSPPSPWPCSRRGGRGRWPPSPCSSRSRWPGARRARRSPPRPSCPPGAAARPRT